MLSNNNNFLFTFVRVEDSCADIFHTKLYPLQPYPLATQ